MAKAWKVKGIKPKKSYRRNAKIILPVKVAEVYSHAETIHNPENIKELHNMRISVKRLRYSMEFFYINYGENFIALLKVVEGLQDLLGDIHDCDVIEEFLSKYLQTLEGQECVETDALGINALRSRYLERRKTKYEKFLAEWAELEKIDFKAQLLDVIKDKRPKLPKSSAKNVVEADEVVYVTGKGAKYHTENCRLVVAQTPIKLEEAKQSYEPCRVCKPPR